MNSPFEDLVGKRVIVLWTDRAWRRGADWIAFKLISTTDSQVVLQGVTSPNGCSHQGCIFPAQNNDIRDMIEWKEQP